jgi:ERCC4-type nuclease
VKLPMMQYDRERPKIVIPEDFTMVQDTREQKPLFKPADHILTKGLKTGDYSIVGFEKHITIERKSKNDLFGSVFKPRFKKVIARMMDMKWAGLLIEGSEDFIMRKTGYSALEINPLYQQIASWEADGMHIYYANSKRDAQDWVLTRLIKFYNHFREGRS